MFSVSYYSECLIIIFHCNTVSCIIHASYALVTIKNIIKNDFVYFQDMSTACPNVVILRYQFHPLSNVTFKHSKFTQKEEQSIQQNLIKTPETVATKTNIETSNNEIVNKVSG